MEKTRIPAPEAKDPPLPPPLDVKLERADFMYYNWTLALERPVFTFLMYTFILLTLASMVGIWPAARLYAFAALIPLLGYMLFVWLTARNLWQRFPSIRAPRRYLFKTNSYLIEEEGNKIPVPFERLEWVLESRSGFYLIRKDGGADLLPKRNLGDNTSFRRFLHTKVPEVARSSFL